jgi:hypothetical protein
MVRPLAFGFNPETAASNAFQQTPTGDARAPMPPDILTEFDALVRALRGAGVRVVVAEDTPEPVKPDAVFPNNWISFHADGTVVLYPMLAPNRRQERRTDLIQRLAREEAFRVLDTIDLSYREAEGKFLEGTGSLVLDRSTRIAYASWSPRTDRDVLAEFAQRLDYEVLAFAAVDGAGKPIYHTNVMMAVGTRFAVVCLAAIANPQQRAAVVTRLEATGHTIIPISLAQMQCFAGNVLELDTARGPVIALSTTAWASLDAQQRLALESHARILAVDIPTIERLGGGGLRCMLAEIHLPVRERNLLS